MKKQKEDNPTSAAEKEFRYERKYFVDQLDARQAISLIKRHPGMFSEIYPPRYINNIYFDSPLMDNYADNMDGSPIRKKARIRWYHDLFRQVDQPVLEFKIKDGLMGTKVTTTFPGFKFEAGFSGNTFKKLISKSNMPPETIQYLAAVEPVLVNRYLRWYLATPDRGFRVTIDADLTFYHLNKFNNRFLFRQTDRKAVVIELKYRHELDPEANRISAGFPFRMTRSSKYVQGIERVYL